MKNSFFNKNKWKIAGILVTAIIILNSCFQTRNMKNSEYEYVLYWDHVVLIKYIGRDTTVQIPEHILGRPVTVLGRECFSENENIEEVMISGSVIDVEESAFFDCKNLKKVTLGTNMKYTGEFMFSDCIALEEVIIPKGIEEIRYGSFDGCVSLSQCVLPDTIRSISETAFGWCDFEKMTIPETLKYIGRDAFRGNTWKLKQSGAVVCGKNIMIDYNGNESTVFVPEGVETVVGMMWNNENIHELYMPNTATTIYDTFVGGQTITLFIPDSILNLDVGYCDENVKIVTTKDSYAEQYAIEKGIAYEIVDDVQALYDAALERQKAGQD